MDNRNNIPWLSLLILVMAIAIMAGPAGATVNDNSRILGLRVLLSF